MVNETEKLYLSGDTFVVPHLSDSRYWILDTIDSVTHGILMLLLVFWDIVLGPFVFLCEKKLFNQNHTVVILLHISILMFLYLIHGLSLLLEEDLL